MKSKDPIKILVKTDKDSRRDLLIHKLASPLTTVIGYSQMIKNEVVNKNLTPNKKVAKLYQLLEKDLKKLRKMVEELNRNL